ncbi:hypothetical protein A2U01_0086147, partial [Trifolium medium]|nr:hypothetical protein [Trifolium medium]
EDRRVSKIGGELATDEWEGSSGILERTCGDVYDVCKLEA